MQNDELGVTIPTSQISIWWKVCFIIAFLAFIISWGDIIYKRFWPIVPAKVYGEIKIINEGKSVKKGDILVYEIDIDRYMNVPVKVRRALVNGYMVTFDDVKPPNKALGRQKVRVGLTIPKGIDCGKWRLKWTAFYDVSSERTVAVDAQSEQFVVTK